MIKTFILAGALLLAPIQKADEVENPPITDVVEDNTYTYESEERGKAILVLISESEFTMTVITVDGDRLEGQGHYTRDGNILTLSVNGNTLMIEINDELKTFDYYEAPYEENDEGLLYNVEYFYTLGEDKVSLVFFEDLHFEIKCGSVSFNGEYKLNEDGRVVLMLKGVSIYEISIDNEKHSFAPHKCLIENEQGFIDAFIEQTKDIINKYMGMEIFGSFTLGTLCTIAVTLLFNILKSKKINEKTDSNIQASEAAITAAQAAVTVLKNELAELREQTERELNQIRSENKNYQSDFASMNSNLSNLTSAVERNSEALENIDKANKKMDAILKNQVLIACNTDKFVSDGTAKALEEEAKHLEE